MNHQLRKEERTVTCKVWIWSALLGVLIGLIVFAPIYLHHDGQYMDYGDYFLQYIPFIKEMKRMLASGSLAWSWNSFLGDSFTAAYSYYTVYNPFAWFVALFPAEYILYGTLAATLIKLALSMVTACSYIRLFCKRDSTALIGALLYTFSGFTCINTMFYFFLDVIAVFPLLFYGLEILMRTGKRNWYLAALFINAAINYYLFVSTILLTVIYVVFRLELYRLTQWKKEWPVFLRIAGNSFLGTGLASFALLPSFYAILGSGKASESIGTSIRAAYWPQEILERLRTFVAPVESGRYSAFFDSSIWSSTGMFLALFGCFLVLQWCIRKKGWLKNICIFLTICYFVPALNASFSLFSSDLYSRWLYGLVLMFSLATVLTLEEIADGQQAFSRPLLIGISVFTAGLLLFPSLIYLLYANGISVINRFASVCSTETFFGYERMAAMLALTAINYVVLWRLASSKTFRIKAAMWCVIFCCVLNFFVYNAINYDVHPSDYSNSDYYTKTFSEGVESTSQKYEYRIDCPPQIANYGLFKNMPSVRYYNSLQHPGSSQFAAAVGIAENVQDTVLTGPEENREYTDALLSVKYYLDYDGSAKIPNGFILEQQQNGVDVYLNGNYIPMGFVYDSYCTEESCQALSPEQNAHMMLHSLVVQKKDLPSVQKYLRPFADQCTVQSFKNEIIARQKTAGKEFVGTSDGFEAKIALEKDNLVFYSVPYDEGWDITVNGVQVVPLSVNYGLLGIPCVTVKPSGVAEEPRHQPWLG